MGSDDQRPDRPAYQEQLVKRVSRQERRKLRAREQGSGVWFGFGMFGMVGWSIAVPTLAGIALGVWIDRTWPSRYSATLMGLFVGVALGCWIAWYWIQRESGER